MPRSNTNRYEDLGTGVARLTTVGGAAFLLDAADVSVARRHGWYRDVSGYAKATYRENGRARRIYLHRLLCPTCPEQPHVDHVNGDIADNRRQNLRPCTHAQNIRNAKVNSRSSTGVKGVGRIPSGKYTATVARVYLGSFATIEAADAAARAFRERVHGEFARHA